MKLDQSSTYTSVSVLKTDESSRNVGENPICFRMLMFLIIIFISKCFHFYEYYLALLCYYYLFYRFKKIC